MTTTRQESHPVALLRATTALRQAEAASANLAPELVERLRSRMSAEQYDAMEAEAANIRATVPVLRAELDQLRAASCNRCSGTGYYQGPTGHRDAKGRPVCFGCGGTGRS